MRLDLTALFGSRVFGLSDLGEHIRRDAHSLRQLGLKAMWLFIQTRTKPFFYRELRITHAAIFAISTPYSIAKIAN